MSIVKVKTKKGYDYVKKEFLPFWIKQGYVIALAEGETLTIKKAKLYHSYYGISVIHDADTKEVRFSLQ